MNRFRTFEEVVEDTVEDYPWLVPLRDELGIGMELGCVVRFLYKQNSGPHAMDAIRSILIAGQPMPDELKPWVLKAVEAWEAAKGNKARTSQYNADRDRSLAIGWISFFGELGIQREQAAQIVTKTYPQFSADHLLQLHSKGDSKSSREAGCSLATRYLKVVEERGEMAELTKMLKELTGK